MTGAGGVARQRNGPRVTVATISRVLDMGLSSPFNLGTAIAPPAVDAIGADFSI